MNDANLSPDSGGTAPTSPPPVEETILRIPGAILHLICSNESVELASGEFAVVLLWQGENINGVLARVGAGDDSEVCDVQWPITRDEGSVKLDDSHYLFSFHASKTKFFLTLESKGQDELLRKLDGVLKTYCSFSVQNVADNAASALDRSVVKDVTQAESLSPNVMDYSGSVAKAIAKGSEHIVKGILWCGDATVERLKLGEEMVKSRLKPCSQSKEINKEVLEKTKSVRSITETSETAVNGILEGVNRASGFVTRSILNWKAGKSFFELLPGEIVLATLDGFAKVSDAVEVVGKNVLQTSSEMATGVVSHVYGEQAAEMTNEVLGAAGHALGTACSLYRIRKALFPEKASKQVKNLENASKQVKNLENASKQVKNFEKASKQVKNLENVSKQVKNIEVSKQVKNIEKVSKQVKNLEKVSKQVKNLEKVSKQVKNSENAFNHVKDFVKASKQVKK